MRISVNNTGNDKFSYKSEMIRKAVLRIYEKKIENNETTRFHFVNLS